MLINPPMPTTIISSSLVPLLSNYNIANYFKNPNSCIAYITKEACSEVFAEYLAIKCVNFRVTLRTPTPFPTYTQKPPRQLTCK
ncbi:hypothetical protein GE21DRAFT_1219549 [Neurospora crassa]|nr:hypothetical protein GE21DRAFT_1219549 [Neurospora crassa]